MTQYQIILKENGSKFIINVSYFLVYIQPSYSIFSRLNFPYVHHSFDLDFIVNFIHHIHDYQELNFFQIAVGIILLLIGRRDFKRANSDENLPRLQRLNDTAMALAFLIAGKNHTTSSLCDINSLIFQQSWTYSSALLMRMMSRTTILPITLLR